jgi:hypothetical protein
LRKQDLSQGELKSQLDEVAIIREGQLLCAAARRALSQLVQDVPQLIRQFLRLFQGVTFADYALINRFTNLCATF